jgi:rhamnose transport system ATP-binding protein
VATRRRTEITEAELIRLMVGRDAQAVFARNHHQPAGAPVLEVRELGRRGLFKDISLTVHAGEIVALAGLVGAGRSEIARAIFGVDDYDVGSVRLAGAPLRKGDPRASVQAGMAFVPEDRKAEGLALRMAVAENISILLSRRFSTLGWVRRGDERRLAETYFHRLDVRARSVRQPVGELSGGNQQKVVIARWLATDPKVIILDEPTRGVDVGAKEEIHRLLDQLAADGLGLLMISSDLPEVIGMADRVVVVREGRVAGVLASDVATADEIMRLAASATKAAGAVGAGQS